MNDEPPEIKEYTPEQRKLLGKAYRMILSWPRKTAEQVQSTICSDEMTASRKPTLSPSIGVASLPENKQG
jgi:hypothetical protein